MAKVTKKNPRGAGRKRSEIEMTYKHFRLPLKKRIMIEDYYSKKQLSEMFLNWVDTIIEQKKYK